MLGEVEVGGRRKAGNAPKTIRAMSDGFSVWDCKSYLAIRASKARGAKAGLFLLVAMFLCLSSVSFYEAWKDMAEYGELQNWRTLGDGLAAIFLAGISLVQLVLQFVCRRT
jgi:hypothetical protein